MTSTTDVSVKESSKNLVNEETLKEWGKQEISQNDIVIPRILLMQPVSEMVADGKFKLGDLVENLDMTKLGDLEKSFEIIPFKLDRVWKIMGGEKFTKLHDLFPVVSNPTSKDYNDNLEFEGKDAEDKDIKRYRAHRFFVMLPSELEELGDAALPYMIEFKSTSFPAGKKLVTRMYTKNAASGLSPAAKTFELSVNKTKNDSGTFAVLDVVMKRDTTKAEEAKCLEWFKLLKGGAKIQEGGE